MHCRPSFLNYRPIFSDAERATLAALSEEHPLEALLENPRAFEDAAISFSFASAKIDGNAFELRDAVDLLKFGCTAKSMPFDDALALKNVHEAFVEVCCGRHAHPVLSVPFLCDLHKTVTHGLPGYVCKEPESVTGGTRGPLDVLLAEAQEIENAFERAAYVHLNLARLKHFPVGNGRTARLMQAAVLADAGLVPLLPNVDDVVPCQQGILAYCETGDPSSHAQLFFRGYRHTIDFLKGRTEAQLKAQEEAEKAIAACRRRRLNQ